MSSVRSTCCRRWCDGQFSNSTSCRARFSWMLSGRDSWKARATRNRSAPGSSRSRNRARACFEKETGPWGLCILSFPVVAKLGDPEGGDGGKVDQVAVGGRLDDVDGRDGQLVVLGRVPADGIPRSEEHTAGLQSH